MANAAFYVNAYDMYYRLSETIKLNIPILTQNGEPCLKTTNLIDNNLMINIIF